MARQLQAHPPVLPGGGAVIVQTGATDAEGTLIPPGGGEIVLSLPASEGLERQADDVERVIRASGTGTEPLVIVVEAAEELRAPELAPVLSAAERAPRPVILRVIRPSER